MVHGIRVFGYGADGDVKCYRSDTAGLLASQNSRAKGFDQNTRLAAKKALELLGERLGPKVRYDILRFWQDALEGRGEVILEIENVPSFSRYAKLKKALGKIKAIKSITGTYSNKIARLSIQSNTRAEKLAEKIVEEMEELEISDVSQNVIKGKLK